MPGDNDDKLKQLHKQLSTDFSDIPPYPDFVTALQDKTKVAQLHQVMQQNYSDVPDFGTFAKSMQNTPYNPAATTIDKDNDFNAINTITPINVTDIRNTDTITGKEVADTHRLSYNVNPVIAQKIIASAKAKGVDPYTALAVAYQETGISNTDQQNGNIENNPFHIWQPDDSKDDRFSTPNGTIDASIDFLKNKLALGAKYSKDEARQIQTFNGTGTIKLGHDDLEGSKKIYGIPIPTTGINLGQNPLYGKRVIDIRDNILKKNAYINSLVKGK